MKVSIIVAKSQNDAIGIDNSLPWHLPNDLKYFKQQTLNKPILMGRKTYLSIGKPLPQRTNIILTTQTDFVADGFLVVNSVDSALKLAKNYGDELMVIGGSEVYTALLPYTQKIYLTLVDSYIHGDKFFPKLDENVWVETSRETNLSDEKHMYNYSFIILDRI